MQTPRDVPPDLSSFTTGAFTFSSKNALMLIDSSVGHVNQSLSPDRSLLRATFSSFVRHPRRHV